MNTATLQQARALPKPTEAQMRVVAHKLCFQAYQLIRYCFFEKNGERTDVLARECKNINVPDTKYKNYGVIKSLGLDIECVLIPNYKVIDGETRKGVIGTWYVTIADPQKWYSLGAEHAPLNRPTKAANDSEF